MWLKQAGAGEIDSERGHRFDQSGLTLQAAVQGLGVAMGRTPIVDRKLADKSLVEPFNSRLKSSGGYWLIIKATVEMRKHVEEFTTWILKESSMEQDHASITTGNSNVEQRVHGELVFTQVQVCEKALDNAIASNSQPSSPFEHYFHQLIEPEHHRAGRNGFGGD